MKYACPRWLDEVHKSARRQAEVSEFMERRVSPVTERMAQVFGRVPLTLEHVHAMYRLCGFLVAHYNETETWCSAFREEDMADLEYVEDLDSFITYSYGSNLNRHMGCPLASKLVQRFREAMDSKSKPVMNAEFMFGHAETIIFFATFMGLYRDPYPLTANISDSELRNRRFRTSLFAPFSANYMFEVYRRLPASPASAGPDHLIRLLVNESPAVIPDIPQSLEGYYAADAVVDHLARHGVCRFIKECEKREGEGLRYVDLFRVQ